MHACMRGGAVQEVEWLMAWNHKPNAAAHVMAATVRMGGLDTARELVSRGRGWEGPACMYACVPGAGWGASMLPCPAVLPGWDHSIHVHLPDQDAHTADRRQSAMVYSSI